MSANCVANCPDFGSPLCAESNLLDKFNKSFAMVADGKYMSVGPFPNGLEQDDVLIGLQSGNETAGQDSVNLGCMACKRCVTVTHMAKGDHFIERRENIKFE